jgi:hypothetical protein
MMPSPRQRRANRQHFSRTPDLDQSRSDKRFVDGLGPWLLVALVVALLFGIVLVTH